MGRAFQYAAALVALNNFGIPFAVTSVDQGKQSAFGQTHDRE